MVKSRFLQLNAIVILKGVWIDFFVDNIPHSSDSIALFPLREGLVWFLRWKLPLVSLEAGSAKACLSSFAHTKARCVRIQFQQNDENANVHVSCPSGCCDIHDKGMSLVKIDERH